MKNSIKQGLMVEVSASGDAERTGRLTRLQRAELECVRQSAYPITAYDLHDRMKRATVARLRSRQTYIARVHPEDPLGDAFVICNVCGTACEVGDPALNEAIIRCSATLGFKQNDTWWRLMAFAQPAPSQA